MAVQSSTQGRHLPDSASDAAIDGAPLDERRPTIRGWWASVRSGAPITGRLRSRYLLVIDVAGFAFASFLALAFRFDSEIAAQRFVAYAPIIAILVLARIATGIKGGLYNRGWRMAGVPELERILVGVVAGSLLAGATVYALGWAQEASFHGATVTEGFPRSFWISELLVSLAVLGGVRFAIRAAAEREHRPGSSLANVRRTLLYGAGETGHVIARSALRNPDAGVLPVGYLDDDPDLEGKHMGNLRVFGAVESMERAVEATGAEALLITMPRASGKAVRRVVDAAMALGLAVRTVPSMNDLLDGTLDAHRVRSVQVDDLLRRPPATDHAAAVREIIEGRTVLITGAGGSIGSELARQVHALGPNRLVLVDRAESPLYMIQRALETRNEHGLGGGDVRAHLVNVASRPAIDRLIALERPDVIFHAAAYKHVPMMEDHPSDAVHVNMGGTLALLEASIAADVERFVLVSTDKAVRPSSVMGASKRVAEMLVADAASRTGRPYVAVRFGNVLGSTGSVVPIFQEQLAKSEPLTITHPDMTRFFMTIPEATWLILDAAAVGKSGDLFVLEMGEPVKIMDLAHDLVRLSGRDPETQPMRMVGLRPGEKLHEVLFYDEEDVQPTEVAKLLRAVAEPPPVTVRADVKTLLAMATGGDETALRLALMAYVSGMGVPQAHGMMGVSQDIADDDRDIPELVAVPIFDTAAPPASEASILIG